MTSPVSDIVSYHHALLLLCLAQGVRGCGGSCATLWYFWFGIFMVLMIAFILLIVGVNFCMKRHNEKKLITRHFRIGPQHDGKTEDAEKKLPEPSTYDVQVIDAEKGISQDVDDDHQQKASSDNESTISVSSSDSVVSDVVPLPDMEGRTSRQTGFPGVSPRVPAFAHPVHRTPVETAFSRGASTAGDQSSRSEGSRLQSASRDLETGEGTSLPAVHRKIRPLSPSVRSLTSSNGDVDLNRTINLSSSGPILVVETPR